MFDGTDRCEDWSAFLVMFEIFADASGWTDEEKPKPTMLVFNRSG